jgi:hypothetical protein
MRDMTIMESFLKQGGTEMAPMSTSREKTVAWRYAASVTPLVFHFKVRAGLPHCLFQFAGWAHTTRSTKRMLHSKSICVRDVVPLANECLTASRMQFTCRHT